MDDNVQDSVYIKKEEKSLISNKIKSEIADTISNFFFSTKEEKSLISDKKYCICILKVNVNGIQVQVV